MAFVLLYHESRTWQLWGLDRDGSFLNRKSPILNRVLAKQIFGEFLNCIEFLVGSLSPWWEEIPHEASIFSNVLWDSINKAELRWQEGIVTINLNQEQGLVCIPEIHLVSSLEIVLNTYLWTILVKEKCGRWFLFEKYISHNVSLPMTVVGNHWLVLELIENSSFRIFYSPILPNFLHDFEASNVAHELGNSVNHNSNSFIIGKCCCSEARTGFDTTLKDYTSTLIEEPGISSDLSEFGFSEALLDDVVQECLNHIVVLHFGWLELLARKVLLRLMVDLHEIIHLVKLGFNQEGLIKVRGGEDSLTSQNILSKELN